MAKRLLRCSALFPDVVNCMQTDNLELKKLVYLYLMNYAKSQPDMAIMAVNTFVKVTGAPRARGVSRPCSGLASHRERGRRGPAQPGEKMFSGRLWCIRWWGQELRGEVPLAGRFARDFGVCWVFGLFVFKEKKQFTHWGVPRVRRMFCGIWDLGVSRGDVSSGDGWGTSGMFLVLRLWCAPVFGMSPLLREALSLHLLSQPEH